MDQFCFDTGTNTNQDKHNLSFHTNSSFVHGPTSTWTKVKSKYSLIPKADTALVCIWRQHTAKETAWHHDPGEVAKRNTPPPAITTPTHTHTHAWGTPRKSSNVELPMLYYHTQLRCAALMLKKDIILCTMQSLTWLHGYAMVNRVLWSHRDKMTAIMSCFWVHHSHLTLLFKRKLLDYWQQWAKSSF